ncbi:MAG: hypothetical protein LBT55_05455 [Clostridiaceae bacterium]|jgi:hypothetical protein|nr:hypothetical protein [Clostridiaceae bacterium]
MRKPFAFILTAAVFFAAALFSLGGAFWHVADAATQIAFEKVYPENGWLLVENPSHLAADETNLAVLDNTADGKRVFLNGSPITIPDNVKDILFFDGKLLSATADKLFVLSTDGAPVEVRLATSLGAVNLANAEFLSSTDRLFVKVNTDVYAFDSDFRHTETITLASTVFLAAASEEGLVAYHIINEGFPKFLILKYLGGGAWQELVKDTELLAAELQASRDLAILKIHPANAPDDEFYLQVLDINDGGKIIRSYTAADLHVRAISDFKLLEDSIYILDGSGKCVREFSLDDIRTGNPPTEISFAGSVGDGGFLNSPSDITLANGTPFIADFANNRIVSPAAAPFNFDFAPAALTSYGTFVYAAGEKSVVVLAAMEGEGGLTLTKKEEIALTDLTSAITDIETAQGIIVILSGGKIYTRGESGFTPLQNVSGVTELSISEKGSLIYALDASGISSYSLQGVKQPFSIPTSALPSQATDFKVDYVGNIYVQSGANITKFTRTTRGYDLADTLTLYNVNYPTGNVTSITLGSDRRIHFTSSNHFAGVSTVVNFSVSDHTGLVDRNRSIPPFPKITEAKTTDGAVFYKDVGDFERAEAMSVDDRVIIFDELSDDEYAFVLIAGDRFGFIEKRFLYITGSAEPPYVRGRTIPEKCNFYEYPSVYAPYATVDGYTRAELTAELYFMTSVTADWEWIKVTYNGHDYYTPSYNLTEDQDEPIIIEADAVYNKILSRKLGRYIKVYDEPGGSTVVTQLRDGLRVQVLGKTEDGKYVKIRFKNTVGYVGASDLTPNPLTPAEILGLVLGVVAAVAAAIIFILLGRYNKKRQKR